MKWFLKIARLALAVSLLWVMTPRGAGAQESDPVYIVQPGDTLFGIARQFGVTVEALQAANPTVNANALPIGQALFIPGFDEFSGTLSVHLLEPGESLASLARRYGLRRETLVRLNRILNPDQLYINQPVIVVDRAETLAIASGETVELDAGQSVLALIAARNANPWAVAAANELAQPAAVPPGARLAFPGDETPLKALPAAIRDLRLWPFPIQQGRTLVIQVVTRAPAQLSGALGEWPLNFVADPAAPNTYYALHGIYRLAEPSLYPLSVQVVDESGRAAAFVQSLPVRAGQYGTDPPLTVPPETLDPANIQPEFERVRAIVTQVTPDKLWSGKFLLPSVGVIRSRFGSLRSYNGGPYDSFHGGTDFSGGEDRPITAPAVGIVRLAENLTVRGGATILDHGWGVFTGYWHQSQILVKVGDRVEPGQIIGYNGATGRVTGPHLHWEVWVNGFQVEPLEWTEVAFP
jgi:murein DD-endopeptidase MepM/ murein hydrolase activator NlpD